MSDGLGNTNYFQLHAGWVGDSRVSSAEHQRACVRDAAPWLVALVVTLRANLALAAPASFIVPANGATEFDSSGTFQWTAVPGAEAYYLYVGSSPGAKDIINSGEISQTKYPATALPAGERVYARIHTKFATGWEFTDISFTVRATAVFLTPTPDTIIEPRAQFRWTAVKGAEAYYLYVGSTPGAKDIVNSGEIAATSLSPGPLPSGRTVYARLHTKVAGVWRSVDAAYHVSPIATLIEPLNNSFDVDPRSNLRWTSVEGAEAYYLYVGTAPGLKDLVNTGETLRTTWPAASIPAGQTVYARIFTKIDGVWRYEDSKFSLRPVAVFLNPQDDEYELDPRSTLMWTSVPGAEAYYLYVGTTPGAKDLINSGETSKLEWPIRSLPRAKRLYARLHTKHKGTWRYVDMEFTLRPVAILEDPSDGATNVDTRYPMRWSPVEGAEAYYLYIGTSPGKLDLINSRELRATQYPIDSLPPGTKVYVRLHTKFQGVWRSVDTTIVTRPVAYLSGYDTTVGILSPDKAFTWSSVPGASKYYVYVGSAPGLQDLASSGEIAETHYAIPVHRAASLPEDGTVYVRFFTLYQGTWRYVDYTMNVESKALLRFPAPDAANVDVTNIRFEWSPVSTAEAYYLYVGTLPGLKDVINSGETSNLYWNANTLPGGRKLYVRLWTKIAGVWRFADSAFVTRDAPAFIYPRNGQRSVTLDRNFSWTTVQGADAYRVTFGSSPGVTNLYDSGSISANEIVPPALPTQTVIYGRVWARKAGVWRFSDAVFTRETTVTTATLMNPTGEYNAAEGFRWQPVPFAASYRLLLGTSPGGSDLLDTGQIKSVRRYVENLELGSTVHATLITRLLDGKEVSRPSTFVVTQPTISFENRLSALRWLVAYVRAMAPINNVPLPNSPLLDPMRARLHEKANCTDYAATLLMLMSDANVGMSARVLNTCLNPNDYDCHTLVEFENSDGRWVIADPTFGTLARRADGKLAGAIDIELATRSHDWGAISYEFVTPDEAAFLNHYYIDYPLLFLNVLAPASGSDYLLPRQSPIEFFDTIPTGSASSSGVYVIQCLAGQTGATILINGSPAEILCTPGIDSLSYVFSANRVDVLGNTQSVQLLKPRRYVF